MNLTLLRKTFEKWWPQLDKALRELTSIYEESTTGYEWLYRPSDLSSIQLNTKCRSIWVVVPLMRDAWKTTCDGDMVEKNIERGIQYRFLLSPPGEIHTVRDRVWKLFEKHSAEKEVCYIDPDTFKKLAVTHFLMLNPQTNDNEYPLRVLLELPVVGHRYWIEVDERTALGFVERFEAICKRRTEQ